MTILNILITLLCMAFILLVSGVGIVFFGEWALCIIREMQHHGIS